VTLPVGIVQVIEGRFINTYILVVIYYFLQLLLRTAFVLRGAFYRPASY